MIKVNGKDCLLDTNIVIGLFADESSITEKIKSFSGSIFIPSIVLGELFYGAEQSSRRDENRKKIEELALQQHQEYIHRSLVIFQRSSNTHCQATLPHPYAKLVKEFRCPVRCERKNYVLKSMRLKLKLLTFFEWTSAIKR